jgi:hypothetical protein
MIIDPHKIRDVYVGTEPGSLMRGFQIDQCGQFRLARRDAELHSVKIITQGSSGFLELADWSGRPLWRQPSSFSGSFILGVYADHGLVIMQDMAIPASVLVSWREADKDVV